MESGDTKISVVIPIYNPDPHYFQNTLDSILNQSYTNIEIIISDDSDRQLDREAISKYNKIKPGTAIKYLAHNGPNGIFSNLNHAIQHAEGEFIQIFCQDDEMKENILEEHIRIFKNNPEVGVVFSQFDVISPAGEKYKLESKFDFRYQFPDYINKQDMRYWLLVFGCLPGNLSPVMLRKSVIAKVGLFNPGLKYAGDFDYWSRAAQHVDFYFNKSSLLYVRNHEQQASRSLSYLELIKDRSKVYSYLLENQSYPIDKGKMSWYLNQHIGSQHFHLFMLSLIKHKFILPRLKAHLSLLNQKPFNLIKSALMYIATLNGRIEWLSYSLKGD